MDTGTDTMEHFHTMEVLLVVQIGFFSNFIYI